MKNWKSTSSFFVFVLAYVYTVYQSMDAGVIEISGYIALWSSLFMMLRNDLTPTLIEKLSDAISNTKG